MKNEQRKIWTAVCSGDLVAVTRLGYWAIGDDSLQMKF